MLITTKTVETKEQQIEIKTPFFSKNGNHFFMICENGDAIQLNSNLISKWKAGSLYNGEITSDALKGEEIAEDEFMAAYDGALANFETSMFPEAMKINE